MREKRGNYAQIRRMRNKKFALCIIVFAFPVNAHAAQPDCQTLGSVRSKNSGTPASIRFINTKNLDVYTYWIDFGGEKRFYTTIKPGDTFVQPTYLTHPWIIVDAAGQCKGPYMPRPGHSVIKLS